MYGSQAWDHVVTYLFNDGSDHTVQAVLKLLFCLSLPNTRATDMLHYIWYTEWLPDALHFINVSLKV